jgi:TolA-binding protein
MPFARSLMLLAAAAALARAQEPLNRPVPLAPAPAQTSAGQEALTRTAAVRAQELGFPGIASGLYRELLAEPGLNPAGRLGLSLSLAKALIDDGKPGDAAGVLEGLPAPHGALWHLLEGIADAGVHRIEAARAELAAAKAEDLGPADRPWWFFLQGMLAGAAGEPLAAGDFYQQAENAATTDLERARFYLAHEQARMRIGPVTAEQAAAVNRNAEQRAGTPIGYDFERSYAVMLDALGQKREAIAALQRDLALLPRMERAWADDFRLLLGLIAGAADGPGRASLVQLLETGSDPDRQRVALQLLAGASVAPPVRAAFRAELDKLIALTPAHPILEDLLFFRADCALADKAYGQAEDDARSLLEKFPGSPLKAYALDVLTRSAWEQRRYRTAADEANQARAALPPGEARAELGVVVAEAWFRAGDFKGAADAYAAALADRPAIVQPGDIMFQRVEAQIEAGSPADAEKVLDDLSRDPAFDAASRWKAEWNLARALQIHGDVQAAYTRVNRLLAGPAPAGGAVLPPDLRVTMAWLQARLSYAAGEYARTLDLVDALVKTLSGLSADLRDRVASTGALLKAQACFALKREEAALAILKSLRADFPKADAAVYSYIVEADHYADQDNIVGAQQLLTRLAEEFPGSDYAAYALYEAALEAERLGQDKNLIEAEKLIENLVTRYPDSTLVFDARLKEGDLFRRLNDFPKAQQVYESLRNNYPKHPDVIYAELALAECHHAQATADPAHAQTAIDLFEDIRDRVAAPADVRVEAGFSLGDIYRRRGSPDRALAVWWREVVLPFLVEPGPGSVLGPNGRFWMTKTLLALGDLSADQGKLDDARKFWTLIQSSGLPGSALAQVKIGRLIPTEAKP